MPVFPGGQPKLLALLTDSLRYPAQAWRDGVQGKVYLSFTVDPTGSVTDIFVKQGVRADLDAEALRNARRLTTVRWEPGTQNGRPVPVVYTMPLTFTLTPTTAPGPQPDSLDVDGGKASLLPVWSWAASQQQIPADKGVLYGSCVQRLGFSSGGFGQYARLVNLTTRQAFRINVKPAFRSRRENRFCVALPPGRYALHYYQYTASKWYGGEMHTEPLRKARSGPALADTRYLFTVLPGQVSYVGTWNFSQPGQPAFTNVKGQLDADAQPVYKHLKLAEAATALPR
ncbi:energy transducer TonB [Hymenobacter algoricola]|uniref:TonB C-terminal domain-containing protein n=1 Tax=Hymenobacter algoricola TaxID=486267 RepID=A0ABP7NX57_9BACT